MYAMQPAQNDDEYFDRWALHYSSSVDHNVCPFYEWFGFKLSADTLKVCGTLKSFGESCSLENTPDPFPMNC